MGRSSYTLLVYRHVVGSNDDSEVIIGKDPVIPPRGLLLFIVHVADWLLNVAISKFLYRNFWKKNV